MYSVPYSKCNNLIVLLIIPSLLIKGVSSGKFKYLLTDLPSTPGPEKSKFDFGTILFSSLGIFRCLIYFLCVYGQAISSSVAEH